MPAAVKPVATAIDPATLPTPPQPVGDAASKNDGTSKQATADAVAIPTAIAAIAPVSTASAVPAAGTTGSSASPTSPGVTPASDASAKATKPLPAAAIATKAGPAADDDKGAATQQPQGTDSIDNASTVDADNASSASGATKPPAFGEAKTASAPVRSDDFVVVPRAPRPATMSDDNVAIPHLDAAASIANTTPTVAATPQSAATTAGAMQPLTSMPATAPAAAVPIQGLAVEIAARAQSGSNRFEIRLDPPDLGRIDVRLDVDRDGQVKSRLVVDRPETLDLLRRDAPQLERALQDAGLKMGDNGLQFSLRDQSAGSGNSRQLPTPGATTVVASDDTLPPLEVTQRSYASLAGLRGGVDIHV